MNSILNKMKRICRSRLCLVMLMLLIVVSAEAYAKNNHEGEVNKERQNRIESSRILTFINDAETLPPLFPFRRQDYVGYGVAILGMLVAAGGGVGGGSFLVPTYLLLLKYPVKHAISFASITVFGAAIANNLLNARKKHPNYSRRSIIDWELILQLEPMAILGALIGALLKNFLPDLLLIVMMLVLLAVTARETLSKAYKLHQRENEDCLKSTGGTGETTPLIEDPATKINIYETDPEKQDEGDSSSAAVVLAAKLTSLFALVTMLNLLSGAIGESSSGPMSLDASGANFFWATLVIMILTLLTFALHQRRDLLSKIQNGVFVYSDIVWTEKNTITYPCYATLAGLVAGLFGIGGGIIKGPLMLALGVHPAVASATTACMILYTSSTATVTYMAHGLLVPDYAVFCLFAGFVSTVVGQTVMSVLLQRYKRYSYIAYSIGIVVAISAVAMAVEFIVAIRFNAREEAA
jgi:uncharacterized membrane protein YfcA